MRPPQEEERRGLRPELRDGGPDSHNEFLLRIRTRRFAGRCARHKRYNPAVDGRGGIKGGCQRCALLADIYEVSINLNGLIRRFDPKHDDVQRPPSEAVWHDPRQLSFLDLIGEAEWGNE